MDGRVMKIPSIIQSPDAPSKLNDALDLLIQKTKLGEVIADRVMTPMLELVHVKQVQPNAIQEAVKTLSA
jgi:hypothetical protein